MDETTSTETSQPQPTRGLNPIIVIVVLVVLGIAGWKLIGGYKTPSATPTETLTPTTTTEASPPSPAPAVEAVATVEPGGVKSFQVEEGSFYFKPNIIRVNLGDKVKITLTAVDAQHDLVIDELNVKSPTNKSGSTNTVEFTADKIGTFEFYCAIGSHRVNGMVGKLIVE